MEEGELSDKSNQKANIIREELDGFEKNWMEMDSRRIEWRLIDDGSREDGDLGNSSNTKISGKTNFVENVKMMEEIVQVVELDEQIIGNELDGDMMIDDDLGNSSNTKISGKTNFVENVKMMEEIMQVVELDEQLIGNELDGDMMIDDDLGNSSNTKISGKTNFVENMKMMEENMEESGNGSNTYDSKYDPTEEEMENHRKLIKDKELLLSKKAVNMLFRERDVVCYCGKCVDLDELEYCCGLIYPINLNIQKRMGQKMSEKLDEIFWNGNFDKCIVECANFNKYLREEMVQTFESGYKYALNKNVCEWKSENYRFYSYSMLVSDLHLQLKKKRIPLPACVIRAIRQKWPSETYTGFLSAFPYAYEEEF
ncbi:unnamed protein product [Caenorhabditis angaria]|uniref:Uncharacterized protein n=1 Tax=Caenorhabditis angaria TaxID=860376 RepID=A0A9P1N184_9PELO|nr:unnamed protein product [Caenorhabditis angaria]